MWTELLLLKEMGTAQTVIASQRDTADCVLCASLYLCSWLIVREKGSVNKNDIDNTLATDILAAPLRCLFSRDSEKQDEDSLSSLAVSAVYTGAM